jgi:hypothetical protein
MVLKLALIRLTIIFALLISFGAAKNEAEAGALLVAGPDAVAEVEFQLQVAAQMNKNQAGTVAGNNTIGGDQREVFLKLGRVVVNGQVTPVANLFLRFAQDNNGKNYATPAGMKALDSWVQFNFPNGPKILAGIFPVQFSRSGLTDAIRLVSFDAPFLDAFMLDSGGLDGKRDRGILLWGSYSGMQYRLAAGNGAQPLAQNIGGQTMRYHGRVHFSLGAPEDDLLYSESYFGEKNIMTIGYGMDKQDGVSSDQNGQPAPYAAWTADFLLESKTESGSSSLEYSYYSYDWGNPNRTDAAGNFVQGQGWQGLYSFTTGQSAGGVQTYARYSVWNPNSTTAGAAQNRLAVGLNFLIRGNNVKWGTEYEQVSFQNQGTTWDKKNYGKYGVQWQVIF